LKQFDDMRKMMKMVSQNKVPGRKK
jgi:hypothetical protein